MSQKSFHCIYDNVHAVQVYNKNELIETRNITITVTEFVDFIQVKARDVCEFVFNYTAVINNRLFEMMRVEQCLDIDYLEFKTNLIDLLQQNQHHEMLLKCQTDSVKYLQVTDQKEIFDEMNENILELKNFNENLTLQMQNLKKSLHGRDLQIEQYLQTNNKMKKQFMQDLEAVGKVFNTKFQYHTLNIINRIQQQTQKLYKLVEDIKTIKTKIEHNSESNVHLHQTIANIRLDNAEITKMINNLKQENAELKKVQYHNEQLVADMQKKCHDKDLEMNEISKQMGIFENDLKQATMIIAQKTTANDELARDLVQANQMLVNFNNLYDSKIKENENLQESLRNNEKVFKEHNQTLKDTVREFQEYQEKYNGNEFKKIQHELFVTNKKIMDLEKINRETQKLNELLTRKLATGNVGTRLQFN